MTSSSKPDPSEISDGYHTFDELYEHRHHLFLLLMQCTKYRGWFSRVNDDDSLIEGWFIAGIELPTGPITYYLPDRLLEAAMATGCDELDKAPPWDGHTPEDVLKRISKMFGKYGFVRKL
jgi:hypothetical protein